VCVCVCVCVCECGGSHLSWVSDVVSSFSWKSFRRSSREKCLSTSSSLSTTQLLRAFLCACRWKIFSSMEPVWWRDHHYSLIWETYMYVVTIWGITIIQKVVYKQLLWLHVSHSRAQRPGIIWLILVSTIYSECTVLQDVPSIVTRKGGDAYNPRVYHNLLVTINYDIVCNRECYIILHSSTHSFMCVHWQLGHNARWLASCVTQCCWLTDRSLYI